MPARMWRYGIHSILELLRHSLPESLYFKLDFMMLAYSTMTLLYESVVAFTDTWIELLGNLALYRMVVEASDMRDRAAWAGVSRYWYHEYADRSPGWIGLNTVSGSFLIPTFLNGCSTTPTPW